MNDIDPGNLSPQEQREAAKNSITTLQGTVRKREPVKHEGRPSSYKPEYCNNIIEFFNRPHSRKIKKGKVIKTVANDLPFFGEWQRSIDISRETFNAWEAKYPAFLDAVKQCKDLQKEFLASNALQGRFDRVFSIFTAKNITDWKDQKEVKTEHVGNIQHSLAASPELLLLKDKYEEELRNRYNQKAIDI